MRESRKRSIAQAGTPVASGADVEESVLDPFGLLGDPEAEAPRRLAPEPGPQGALQLEQAARLPPEPLTVVDLPEHAIEGGRLGPVLAEPAPGRRTGASIGASARSRVGHLGVKVSGGASESP